MSKSSKSDKSDDGKPYYVFQMCKDKCFNCEYCGYVWGPGHKEAGQKPHWASGKTYHTNEETVVTSINKYSSSLVKEAIAPLYQAYFLKLADGQPSNWKCDQRMSDLFCIGQWLMEELLVNPRCSDDQRRDVQSYFNRNARSQEDLYELAAHSLNLFLDGKMETYRGR